MILLNNRKFSYGLLLAGVIVFFCFALCRKTSGFSAKNCASNIPNRQEWQIALSKEQLQEANAILAQPFSYVGRGYLTYLFTSQDSNYLLRLVRHQRLNPPVFAFSDTAAKRAKRRDRLFKSYKMAFEMLPEESGVLFVHLNKNVSGLKARTIFTVNLAETEFVLQLKGADVIEAIDRLMKKNQVEAAKSKIDQIFSLIKSVSTKGVVNLYHPSANKLNVAFLADRAIFIDSGKLSYHPKLGAIANFKKNVQALRPLNKWLMLRYPALSRYFHEECKRYVTEQA